MIDFNRPHLTGKEAHYMYQAVSKFHLSGNGEYTKKCQQFFEERYGFKKCLLTTSGTDALEMCAMLCDLKPGDEVIIPSYTFVSTALAFLREGAKVVFADSMKRNPNLDAESIESLITPRTKVIVPVHYAGVSCEMDTINDIARRHGIKVVEDAAQGVMSTYKGKALGTLGHYGCYSFHETKNLSMGEGGAILLSDEHEIERAEIIREKGTNRSKFFRGEIDKYTWVSLGSSYLPSELNAAYLYAQLQKCQSVYDDRMRNWNMYYEMLKPLRDRGVIELPVIPEGCVHNAHMFYIKAKDLEVRTKLISYLKSNGIDAVFHYIPLHSSPAGIKYGSFAGDDNYTTKESERLIRLPLYYGLKSDQVEFICEKIGGFYR